MAEGELNVDAIIARLLEGELNEHHATLCTIDMKLETLETQVGSSK